MSTVGISLTTAPDGTAPHSHSQTPFEPPRDNRHSKTASRFRTLRSNQVGASGSSLVSCLAFQRATRISPRHADDNARGGHCLARPNGSSIEAQTEGLRVSRPRGQRARVCGNAPQVEVSAALASGGRLPHPRTGDTRRAPRAPQSSESPAQAATGIICQKRSSSLPRNPSSSRTGARPASLNSPSVASLEITGVCT